MLNKKKIKNNLNTIFSLLDQKKVKFWLDGGALLRFQRKRDIFLSSDFDIGTEFINFSKIIIVCKILEKRGFKISVQNNFPFFCDLIKVYFPAPLDNKNLDIYLYYRDKQELIRPSIHKPRLENFLTKVFFKLLNKHNLGASINLTLFKFYVKYSKFLMHVIPLKYFKFKLNKVVLKGLSFYVPQNLTKYLEYRYGIRWKRYHKNWNASDGSFLRIRKLKKKINFYNQQKFNFNKFKVKRVKRNFKFKFTLKQKKRILSLDEK